VTIYWLSLTTPATDYTVFVHLLDKSGQVAAGWDTPPVNGNYPTHLWSKDEIVEDHHHLTLPPDLASNDYRLVIGLYQIETLQRLAVLDSSGSRVPNDAIPLLVVPVRE
jgi:hypothetical protein